jgi:hypothetical protein
LIYEFVPHTFISTSRSAAVPELWTLGVMNALQQNTKPANPILLMVVGVANFALVSLIFWRTIIGLSAGKIRTLGRGLHYLVIRQDSPGEFWFWIAARFFVVALGLAVSIIVFISCFRRLRR